MTMEVICGYKQFFLFSNWLTFFKAKHNIELKFEHGTLRQKQKSSPIDKGGKVCF